MICLNKKHPAIPRTDEFRPIVVCSPVVKFMEGFLTKSLKSYAINQLHRWQYGFTPGFSIEECKARVLEKVIRLKESSNLRA